MICIFIGKNDAFLHPANGVKMQNRHVFKTSHLVTYYDVSKI